MSLTARDVAEITRLLEESNFDELYLELEGLKLTLRRGQAAVSSGGEAGTGAVGPTVPVAQESPAVVEGGALTASRDPDAVDVVAPLLGTFYRAPKPGAPAFVEVGSQVEEDTIIGIIEVMKLMNTVRAGSRGRVIQILGRDGALVEYGEVLMRLGKAG